MKRPHHEDFAVKTLTFKRLDEITGYYRSNETSGFMSSSLTCFNRVSVRFPL